MLSEEFRWILPVARLVMVVAVGTIGYSCIVMYKYDPVQAIVLHSIVCLQFAFIFLLLGRVMNYSRESPSSHCP